MKRTVLLALLLVAYAGVFGRRLMTGPVEGFDPVSPQAREIERALAGRQFEQALPLATELQMLHPGEPLTALWLARAYNGLQRSADEATAWERFIETGSAPAQACPWIAEAYARSGETGRGLTAYERCAKADPNDPERLLDLGDALARAGRPSDALSAYKQAARLDARHPVIAKRIERLSQPSAGGQR